MFSLANRKDELDRETRNMAALLAKFRIDFSSVLVIPGKACEEYLIQYHGTSHHTSLLDVTKRASEESRSKLNAKLAELPTGTISEVFSHWLSSSRTLSWSGGVGHQQGEDQQAPQAV